jgi:short-subunit dehydrogenase
VTHRRTMIVTGASAGVGRALALQAARGGFGVLAVARRAELLAELAAAAGSGPGAIATLALDIAAAGAPGRIVATALRHFSGIDVLVHNAGYTSAGAITAQSDAELRRQFEVHVLAPLALTREALPSLRAARGHVFFVGSGVARVPVGGLGAYPSSKAALRSAVRTVRSELRADGIAVTYVDPGAVNTEFMRRAGFEGAPKSLAVSPETVARKILRAVTTRPAVLNVVPWQSPALALGELLPSLTDFVLARAPQIVGTTPLAAPAVLQTTAEPAAAASGDAALDEALAPVAQRMARLKLSREFVAGLLVAGAGLDAGDVALRWAGMPNKNERALVHQVLEVLADAGYLERREGEAYRVLRAAEESSAP